MDDKKLLLKFLQFLAQKSGAKTQKDLEKYVQGLGEDGLKKAYEEFSKTLQEEETNKAKKAAHGMKLNYVKNLKNQCADDEELVYFKKGGTLDCGCRKKMLKGGETPKEESMISKFKKFRLKAENTANKLSGKTYTEGKTIILRKSDIEKAKKETEKQPNIDEEAVDMKPKKNCGGAKFIKKGNKIKTGCKKHQWGGELYRQEERPDNTRVQQGIYSKERNLEPVNFGWDDLIPVWGTYKEAKRLDQNDPEASKLGFALGLAGDLTAAKMIGPVARAAAKSNKVLKALKARGFFKPTKSTPYPTRIVPGSTKSGLQWIKIGYKTVKPSSTPWQHLPNVYFQNSYLKTPKGTIHVGIPKPVVSSKVVPEVDYTSAALAPLVQTLRAPAHFISR